MKGIIMAGGEGSRLRPLTADIPKPLVPVANKPAIKHIVEHLYKYGIGNLAVTLFYLPHKIKNYLEEEYGNEIKFYIEEKPLGTAGSVKNARDFLNDTFIVMSGDVITDVNIKEAFEFHRKKGAKVTLILTRVDVPLEYGVVIVDKEGKIKKFLEKPSWGEVFSDTVNTGIYIIEPEILEFIPQDKPFDFSKDLFPMLLKNDIPMYGYITGGYWCDIGNTNQYITSHFDILEGRVDLGYKDKLLKERKIIGKNVTISPEAKIIPPVIIGNNVTIEANTLIGPNVIIGERSFIKEGSSLKNTIVWEEVYVHKNCELRGCVICNRVRIENNVRIFENSVIGEGTRIRPFAEIKPDVRIWPYKTVEQESIVSKDIVWGNGKKILSFGYRGIKGNFNEDITPQAAIEIGEAFGNVVNGKVLIAYDGNFISQFVSDIIAHGLAFSGCEVLKANGTFLPAVRYGIKKNDCEGGIYVQGEGENIQILFLDREGADIDRSLEKKIENKLRVYDMKKVDGRNLKPIREINLKEDYVKFLFENKNAYKKFKIKAYDETTKTLLEEIGNGSFLISGDEYHVGVSLNKDGEKIKIYDERGREFDEDELNYLRMLIAKQQGIKRFVLPFDSSKYLTEFAQEIAIKTVHSKISHKDRMKTILESDKIEREKQFNLNFDGINFLLELLEYLQYNSKELSAIKDGFPLGYKMVKSIKCDLKDKGKIMRQLFEQADEKAEFLDGLKFKETDAWVLVVPDNELPACNIYIEAPTKEKAEELFFIYERKIKSIIEK